MFHRRKHYERVGAASLIKNKEAIVVEGHSIEYIQSKTCSVHLYFLLCGTESDKDSYLHYYEYYYEITYCVHVLDSYSEYSKYI